MNTKDMRLADDSDLAGSVAAIQRVANAAEDTAIRTNTSIIIAVNGQTRRITAAELIEMRSAKAQLEKS